jgi:hypothetical protein
MRRTVVLVVFAAALCPGCRAKQLRHDQDHMRHAVLELYTNQLMDNLIRAHNGLPMVQLDYTNMTGTITQDANGSFGDQQTLETQRNNLGVTTLRKFINFTNLGLGAAQKLQLTVTANPVLNNNEVYNAYLEFLGKPERFVVTHEPPPPGAAHIVRCSSIGTCDDCGRRYYWIPCEYRHDFLRLALVTTVQRGQPLATPEFFENTVTRVEDDTNEKRKDQNYIHVYLKKRIPNDGGKLTFTLAGEPYEFGFLRYPDPVDGAEVKTGRPIDRLLLRLPVKDNKVVRMETDPPTLAKLSPAEFKQLLPGTAVRIDLNLYRPTLPTTEDLIQAIRHEVGLIRLEQQGR